ncbi:MAG TPA: tyrosine-type recombinase/integrase [Casimicrobiaceae bacterium]
MSTLREALGEYLALRRGLGFKLRLAGPRLLDFVAFLEREGASCITNELALRWAMQCSACQPAQWAGRLSFVRGFARHRSATDPRTEVPPYALLPYRPGRARPYLYTEQEIERLLEAAKRLPPAAGLRRWTYYCLFGLLTVTGLRISEAIALERQDVDPHQPHVPAARRDACIRAATRTRDAKHNRKLQRPVAGQSLAASPRGQCG